MPAQRRSLRRSSCRQTLHAGPPLFVYQGLGLGSPRARLEVGYSRKGFRTSCHPQLRAAIKQYAVLTLEVSSGLGRIVHDMGALRVHQMQTAAVPSPSQALPALIQLPDHALICNM